MTRAEWTAAIAAAGLIVVAAYWAFRVHLWWPAGMCALAGLTFLVIIARQGERLDHASAVSDARKRKDEAQR